MELIFCTGSYALRYMQMRTVYDRHVYLHGSSNCGKSFILSPLKVIFQNILQSSYLLLRMDRGRGSQSDFPK